MQTRLYVGNLPYSFGEDDVVSLFSEVGDVSHCTLILDRLTSKSRGFAFVQMGSEDEAQKAIDAFNGREVDGRALVVNEAKPREQRQPAYNNHGGMDQGGGGHDGNRRHGGGRRNKSYN